MIRITHIIHQDLQARRHRLQVHQVHFIHLMMKLNLSKNVKNSLKFAVAAAATFGALYFIAQDPMKLKDWIGCGLCVCTFAWFTWHVYNDK